MTAKEYLLDIGFDDAHLPELFNDDDKSNYQITELMEAYHQAKLKLLGIGGVSNRSKLLIATIEKARYNLDGYGALTSSEIAERLEKAINCC